MGIRALLKDAAWYTFAKGAAGLIGIAIVVFLVRNIGKENYAVYSAACAAALAVAQWSSGWIYHGVMRYGARTDTVLSTQKSTIGLLLISLAVCAPLGVGLLATARLQSLWWPMLLMAAAISAYSLLLGVYQVQLRSGALTVAEVCRSAAALAMLAVCVLNAPNNISLLLLVSGIAYLSPLLFKQVPLPSKIPYKAYWTYGAPLALWMGFYALSPFIDRMLLIRLLGDGEAGRYAAVADLVTRAYALLLFPLALASHGHAVKAHDNQSATHAFTLLKRVLKLQMLLIAVSLPLAVLIGPWIVDRVLGNAMQADGWLLASIALAAGCWQLSMLVHKPLELAERTRLMPLLMSGALVVQLVAGYILIPKFGGTGAAAASAIAALCYIGSAGWAAWRHSGAKHVVV